ncbi:DUF551 domain-containing protein [Pantoea agglomerans]|uniref:DUF551 domain-containing protein n=1 Tax=Enterobacter agglomerans TaxID=549 RepID=UPI0013BCFB8F|nr:DUF551 domain-containing protein [Pantoea agglomerans]NEG85075.1 DUF551 domain-containing protein [Pantoea agglomerans]NEH07022.1 DUF551 domain-containing protein [Pantoea agglomerans]
MSQWIKCSEKMPEIGAKVLVVQHGKYVSSVHYRQWVTAKNEKGRAPRFEDMRGIVYGVTHWQPLPSPPEEA